MSAALRVARLLALRELLGRVWKAAYVAGDLAELDRVDARRRAVSEAIAEVVA